MSDDNLGPAFEDAAADGPVLSDKLYKRLKWGTAILLPAISAAYFSLSGVLSLPYAEQVVGTIAVLTTFFGTVLGVSTRQYNRSDAKFDGAVILSPGEEDDTTDLRFMMDPAALERKSSVLVKVDKSQLPAA